MMKNFFEYRGYIGTINISVEDRVFFGTIHGINDVVTFEAANFDELEAAFKEAVDDYLELCERHGKEPEKAYKGQFNVRISSELHRTIAINATKLNMSLNQYVENALIDFTDETYSRIKQVSGDLKECVNKLNNQIGQQNNRLWGESNTFFSSKQGEIIKEVSHKC